MHLTKEEEKILDGEKGEVMERLFRLLVRLGDIYGADKMKVYHTNPLVILVQSFLRTWLQKVPK
jgi:hypothetical protein